jgi:hypothetical protein
MIQIEASEFLRNLATIERRVLDAARLGVDQVAKVAYRSARETTLFKDQTGELRGTLDILDRGTYGRRLTAPAKHARYIESGSKPHRITAKNVPFLRFVIGGKVFYKRSVNHPGTAARPFMQNAAAAGAQAMAVILNEAAERAVSYP